MKNSALLASFVALLPSLAHATCSKNDSRLANCDSPIGTAAYTHVEIERENCIITATVFQPTPTGEPAPVLAAAVTAFPAVTTGIPDSYKATGFDLSRTDGQGIPATGEFKVHLNADVGGKKISEDLKCYL
jgi:hypothetical protein